MPNLRGKTWTTTTPANVEDAQYWEDHLISNEAAQKAAGAVQSVNNTLPDENGNINITPSPLGPTVVDSLNSTSATDALSANMGHELNEKKVDIHQGAENEGKILKVDENGDLVLDDDEGGAEWGGITGNIADQTDLQTALAPKVSETLLKDTVGWVGKNKFAVKLSDVKANNSSTGTWSGNTYTLNGITATFTTDANDYITEIKITGTSTSSAVFRFLSNAQFDSHDFVNMIINGLPASATQGWNGICYRFWKSDDSASFNLVNEEAVQDIGACNFGIRMASGFTCPSGGYVIYPMLRDASITDSTFEPYHKSVEDWYWENNPNAGAKNRCDLTQRVNESGVSSSITASGTGVRIYNTNAQTYAAIRVPLSLEKNTDYRLKTDVDYISGTGWVMVQYKDGGGSWTTLKDLSSNITGDIDLDDTFNSGSHDSYRLSLFCTRATSETGDITFNDLMIYDARDTNPDFEPYAMTNRELTEKVALREHTYTGTSDANGVVVASTVPHRPIVYCYGAPTGGGNVFVEARPGGGGIAFYCHNNGAKVASTEITIHYFDYQD